MTENLERSYECMWEVRASTLVDGRGATAAGGANDDDEKRRGRRRVHRKDPRESMNVGGTSWRRMHVIVAPTLPKVAFIIFTLISQ
jgi:hypothetical protein